MSSPQKSVDAPPRKDGFGDCPILFAKFSHCLGPLYQLEYVHRNGIYDNCGEYFSDAQSCFMAKVSTNEERKRVNTQLFYHALIELNILFRP